MDNKYGFSREEVIGILSKYVQPNQLEQFVKNHESQIADLQKGNISGVFKGFQKKGNPQETYDARISLKRQKEDGTGKEFITPTFTFRNKVLNIPRAITLDGVQIQFSDQQYNELLNEGRLSETLKFTGQSGVQREMFLAVDRDLNRIAWVPASFFRVPDSLYQTELSQEQKDTLTAGKKTRLEMDFKGGKKSVQVYYDPVLHKIRFEEQRETQGTTEGEKKDVQTPAKRVEPTEKLEGKQKQQTKVKTVSKGTKIGIDS